MLQVLEVHKYLGPRAFGKAVGGLAVVEVHYEFMHLAFETFILTRSC